MARARIHTDLPRWTYRGACGLRFRRPDTRQDVYLKQTDPASLRIAGILADAFGTAVGTKRREHYRRNFLRFDWSAIEAPDRLLIGAYLPDLHPPPKLSPVLGITLEAMDRWAYEKAPVEAYRSKPVKGRTWLPALFAQTVQNAKARKIPWELTFDETRVLYTRSKGRCEVTNIPFSIEQVNTPLKHFRRPWAPSIDRIDAAKGYAAGNCRLVCVAANYAMGQWGEAVLIEMAKGVARKRARSSLDKVKIGGE